MRRLQFVFLCPIADKFVAISLFQSNRSIRTYHIHVLQPAIVLLASQSEVLLHHVDKSFVFSCRHPAVSHINKPKSMQNICHLSTVTLPALLLGQVSRKIDGGYFDAAKSHKCPANDEHFLVICYR